MRINGRKSKTFEEMMERFQKLQDQMDDLERLIQDMKRMAPAIPDLKVKRLHPDAQLPTRGTDGSAGLDLYSVEAVELWPGDIKAIHTGIAMQIPEGYCGLVMTRSSYAKSAVRNAGGATLVDADFRGEVIVFLRNDGEYPWHIASGDRVAQLVIVPYWVCVVIEADELDETQRGASAFGSTGR